MFVHGERLGTLSIDNEEGDDNEQYRMKTVTQPSVHGTKAAGKSKLKLARQGRERKQKTQHSKSIFRQDGFISRASRTSSL